MSGRRVLEEEARYNPDAYAALADLDAGRRPFAPGMTPEQKIECLEELRHG